MKNNNYQMKLSELSLADLIALHKELMHKYDMITNTWYRERAEIVQKKIDTIVNTLDYTK